MSGQKQREYHAIVEDKPGINGHHVSVRAMSIEDAKVELEAVYGKGTIFRLSSREDAEREYQAIIEEAAGARTHRVSIMAMSIVDAMTRLEDLYGKGTVFNLHNRTDALRPR